MHTRRATPRASREGLARRLLIVLALALVMTFAAAGAALAATEHGAKPRQAPAADRTRVPAADESAAKDSSSSVMPLVFAGILILAVASPVLPRYSRYGNSHGGHW
jgi:hypothetical protein